MDGITGTRACFSASRKSRQSLAWILQGSESRHTRALHELQGAELYPPNAPIYFGDILFSKIEAGNLSDWEESDLGAFAGENQKRGATQLPKQDSSNTIAVRCFLALNAELSISVAMQLNKC